MTTRSGGEFVLDVILTRQKIAVRDIVVRDLRPEEERDPSMGRKMNNFDLGILRQAFVDALPDCAMILLDVDGKVLTWNAGGRAILGYAAAEIVGSHFSCLYPKDQIAAARPAAVLDDARALDRHEETTRLVRRDGKEVEVHNVVMPLYDRQKSLLGYGVMTRGPAISKLGPALPAEVIAGQRHEKILIVDDDDSTREVAERQLTTLGYRVIAASDGSEALELLARFPDVDLLFTDVSMPGGMGGREVAEKARQIHPRLKVLFVSGYFEGALVRDGALDESTQFLVKPYRKKNLAQKIEEVLRGTTS